MTWVPHWSVMDYKGGVAMKNILVIQGGGRPKGNTAQLIDSFVKGAMDAGNTVEVVSLMKNEVNILEEQRGSGYGYF